MPVTASVTSVAAPKPKSINHNFSNYVPRKIALYRDGGTIKMEGLINRTFTGDIRFDGALNSPTRGKFFVAVKSMTGSGPEQPMKKSDLRELRQAIAGYIEGNPNAEPTYGILLKNIDQVLGTNQVKLPTATHLKNVLGAWEFHHAKFTLTKPPQLNEGNVLKEYTLSKGMAAYFPNYTLGNGYEELAWAKASKWDEFVTWINQP